MERHRDKFEEVVGKSLDIFGKTMYVAELTRLEKALKKMVLAQTNFEILSQAIKLPDEAEYFFDSLTKLPKHDVSMLGLTSICLECKLRYDKNTYYLSEKNVSQNVNLKIECPNCGGSAVLHYISIGGGGGLKRLVVTRRFQEAIIALTLSELDQIRKIYVGKKVSAVVDGETQKGLEIDIAALTEDGGLLVFEVSTALREPNVVERAIKKLDFSEYGLPFSKFVYLAPTLFKNYLTIGRHGGYIFSAKHIPNLLKFTKETCFNDKN
ncbi:hypothetical protein DRP04_10835 [Archaeoglobales archaeon]|nr:MAG: hypothetical protein DRP04_10835 [Archaeoglobales archaeon]